MWIFTDNYDDWLDVHNVHIYQHLKRGTNM